jgi:hypothetical protein
LTPRALLKALKRPNVKQYMQDVVIKSLGLTAMKASKRIGELLHSPNEMVAFNSSRFALAAGLSIAPPERSGANVNVNIGLVQAGYILDLREDVGEPLPRAPAHPLLVEHAAAEET